MTEPKRLLISFSGGETSAYMTYALMTYMAPFYDETAVVFANTGQEWEQTLEFVARCDDYFGFNTVWIEANVHHNKRKAPTHRRVTFETASRQGEPFEEVVKKYGLPNQSYPHCTRDLKERPIHEYVRSLGWRTGSYDTAIGIRVDEIDRMSPTAREKRLIYPLVDMFPMTKNQINGWWQKQPFRLELAGYQGNCKWCWKKSDRKHWTLMSETPWVYDFPARLEQVYGLNGSNSDGTERVLFRKNRSTLDMFREYDAVKGSFTPVDNDAEFDPDLDAAGSCDESCEVFH